MGKKIRLAIAGVGNCASALVQGIHYYREKDCKDGLIFPEVGGYRPGDIKVVAAWDIDARKVGKDLSEAVFAPPNCTTVFYPDIPKLGVKVRKGKVLDGFAPHMSRYHEDKTFVLSEEKEDELEDVVSVLKETRADVLINYVPVGSEQAACFYAEACLKAEVAFVNAMPAFIVSGDWGKRFEEAGIPAVGDDIKSQVGATIVHRVLTKLMVDRGVPVKRSYQVNFGGNTDFLNMLARERLKTKKISKTEAVNSLLPYDIGEDNIHIGPSDWVPWLKDNKIAYIRLEGELFGGVPMYIELKLSVEDSPNSAGSAIEAIRAAKTALDRGICGPLIVPSAYTMKHPPVQMEDGRARALFVEEYAVSVR